MLLRTHFTYTLTHRFMHSGVWSEPLRLGATFLHLSQAQNSTFLWMQFDRQVGKQLKMLKYDTVPLLRESLQKSRLPSTSVTFPSTSFITYPFAFHCVTDLPPSLLCATSTGTCARPVGVISFFFQSLNYIHCSGLLQSPTPSIIMIIYTARTVILHHPACHIPCFLLSPHFYHPSVPSGIRSSYQWSGASALSGVRSRSRWEGWCWKDSAQGRENTEFKLHCCKPGASSVAVLTPFKHSSVL